MWGVPIQAKPLPPSNIPPDPDDPGSGFRREALTSALQTALTRGFAMLLAALAPVYGAKAGFVRRLRAHRIERGRNPAWEARLLTTLGNSQPWGMERLEDLDRFGLDVGKLLADGRGEAYMPDLAASVLVVLGYLEHLDGMGMCANDENRDVFIALRQLREARPAILRAGERYQQHQLVVASLTATAGEEGEP